MFINALDDGKKILSVAIPLTTGTEKTRIKKRSILNEYGSPVATRQECFTQQCYVEWQIGYDVVTAEADKLQRTPLKTKTFTGANGKNKALYELSEYVYYFYKWGVIRREAIENIKQFLLGADGCQLLDVNRNYVIERSHPTPQKLFDIDFEFTQVKYPLLMHKFQSFEIIAEIKITEKQRAVGVQPMLYFCFPITELAVDVPLLGRTAEVKENANFIIHEANIGVFLEMMKIFGILSGNHRKDILSIIDVILHS
jgi:hypothetical protein